MPRFDLQGHRGARGLKPENTLPGFETALDLGVTTIETDLHLTRDGVVVVLHDAAISPRLFQSLPESSSPDPASRPLVSSLTLAQLRGYRGDRNPDPQRFPRQDNRVTPLAELFASQHGLDPYAPPALSELFAFAAAYARDLGEQAGKTPVQRAQAQRLWFDLELKRVPFRREYIGDQFDGESPGLLEQKVVEAVIAAGVMQRTAVRSFDHRCVLAVRRLAPFLTTAILIAGTAPVIPAMLARQAEAQVYCPDFEFLDETQVRQAHDHGLRVVPWTVNEAEDWQRLVAWGVDGITTDYPDRLATWLGERGISWAS